MERDHVRCAGGERERGPSGESGASRGQLGGAGPTGKY
jgi:hypothetical protein